MTEEKTTRSKSVSSARVDELEVNLEWAMTEVKKLKVLAGKQDEMIKKLVHVYDQVNKAARASLEMNPQVPANTRIGWQNKLDSAMRELKGEIFE